MFTPPAQQIELMLAIGEQVWNDRTITRERIRALGDPPQCPPSDQDHLHCVVLLCNRIEARDTLADNERAADFVLQGGGHCLGRGFVKGYQLERLREGANSRPPGFRWAICELGRLHRYSEKYPTPRQMFAHFTRQGVMGIGPELPGIVAMHPYWCLSTNMMDRPGVIATDLEVTPGGYCGDGPARNWCPALSGDPERGGDMGWFGVDSNIQKGYGCGTIQYMDSGRAE